MKSREKPEAPFPLRLEPDLKSWVRVKARENSRSLNQEIAHALRLLRSDAQKREAQHG